MLSMKSRKWVQVCLVVVGSSLSAADLAASEPKLRTNRTDADAAQRVQESPAANAVSQLGLAYGLVHYGRANKSPMALLTAAEILHRHPADELKAERKAEAGKGTTPENAAPKQDKPAVTVAGLIAEAKALATGNERMLALAAEVEEKTDEVSRGAVGGPKRKVTKVDPFSTDSYTISFRGGEPAVIIASGDGDTDLDMYVYDENGNLIASDDDQTDDCVVRFFPKWTGPFTVRVKNRGWVYNQYVLVTN